MTIEEAKEIIQQFSRGFKSSQLRSDSGFTVLRKESAFGKESPQRILIAGKLLLASLYWQKLWNDPELKEKVVRLSTLRYFGEKTIDTSFLEESEEDMALMREAISQELEETFYDYARSFDNEFRSYLGCRCPDDEFDAIEARAKQADQREALETIKKNNFLKVLIPTMDETESTTAFCKFIFSIDYPDPDLDYWEVVCKHLGIEYEQPSSRTWKFFSEAAAFDGDAEQVEQWVKRYSCDDITLAFDVVRDNKEEFLNRFPKNEIVCIVKAIILLEMADKSKFELGSALHPAILIIKLLRRDNPEEYDELVAWAQENAHPRLRSYY